MILAKRFQRQNGGKDALLVFTAKVLRSFVH